MSGRESAVAEALCRAAHAWPFDPGNDFPCSTCTARAKVAVAALDTPPALGEHERDEIAGHCFNVWSNLNDSTSDNEAMRCFRVEAVPHIEAILAARAHQPTPPAPCPACEGAMSAHHMSPPLQAIHATHDQHTPPEQAEAVAGTTVTERRSLRCGMDAGERPGWMSPGQYDPCPCVRPKGHPRASDGTPGHACGDHDKPADAIEPDRFEERLRTTYADVVTEWAALTPTAATQVAAMRRVADDAAGAAGAGSGL